jgi:hypothetical protein
MDGEYVKRLEEENEMLRRKIDVNPVLRELLGKYFRLKKEVNRSGEADYALDVSTRKLNKEDYEYLTSVGIPDNELTVEEFTNAFIVGTDDDVKKILDEYYKSVKLPENYIKDLKEPCPVKSMDDYKQFFGTTDTTK